MLVEKHNRISVYNFHIEFLNYATKNIQTTVYIIIKTREFFAIFIISIPLTFIYRKYKSSFAQN